MYVGLRNSPIVVVDPSSLFLRRVNTSVDCIIYVTPGRIQILFVRAHNSVRSVISPPPHVASTQQQVLSSLVNQNSIIPTPQARLSATNVN